MAVHLSKPPALALAAVVCTYVVTFLIELYKIQSRILKLKSQGLERIVYSLPRTYKSVS